MSYLLLLLLDEDGSSPPPPPVVLVPPNNGIRAWGAFMWGGTIPLVGSTVVITPPTVVLLINDGGTKFVMGDTVSGTFVALAYTGANGFYRSGKRVSDFWTKKGDTSPPISGYLQSADGSRPNLTGATVLAKAKNMADNSQLINATCTITDAVNAGISYAWATADTAAAAEARLEFEVTFADDSVETFPKPGFIALHIEDDAG